MVKITAKKTGKKTVKQYCEMRIADLPCDNENEVECTLEKVKLYLEQSIKCTKYRWNDKVSVDFYDDWEKNNQWSIEQLQKIGVWIEAKKLETREYLKKSGKTSKK